MDNITTDEMTTWLEDTLPNEISPYGLAKVMTDIKGSLVRPQMVYQYVRDGRISVSYNSTNKKVVGKEEALRFIMKYMNNNAPFEITNE